jgi:hypothetical protein
MAATPKTARGEKRQGGKITTTARWHLKIKKNRLYFHIPIFFCIFAQNNQKPQT